MLKNKKPAPNNLAGCRGVGTMFLPFLPCSELWVAWGDPQTPPNKSQIGTFGLFCDKIFDPNVENNLTAIPKFQKNLGFTRHPPNKASGGRETIFEIEFASLFFGLGASSIPGVLLFFGPRMDSNSSFLALQQCAHRMMGGNEQTDALWVGVLSSVVIAGLMQIFEFQVGCNRFGEKFLGSR